MEIKTKLIERVLELCFKQRRSHLGSSLTALPGIWEIYQGMSGADRFVLSCGHAALAWYVVLEELGQLDNIDSLCPQPKRDDKAIPVSTGSLGMGIPVALGMAMADPKRDVHCMISDGQCAEGSVWESLLLKEKFRVDNLFVYVNANGWSAYEQIDTVALERKLLAMTEVSFIPQFDWAHVLNIDWLSGLKAHYQLLTEEEYQRALNALNGSGQTRIELVPMPPPGPMFPTLRRDTWDHPLGSPPWESRFS